MKKVIMLLLSLFILFGINNVYAGSCNFNKDSNGFGVSINVNANTLNFTGNGNYKVYGTDTKFDSCPKTIYYACNLRNICYVGTDQNKVNKFIPTKTIKGSINSSTLSTPSTGGSSQHVTTGSSCSANGALNNVINKYLIKPIKILLPIMFFVLTTVEFVKVIFSGDKEMKKAVGAFLKRALVMLVVYFAPNVVTLLFNLAKLTC